MDSKVAHKSRSIERKDEGAKYMDLRSVLARAAKPSEPAPSEVWRWQSQPVSAAIRGGYNEISPGFGFDS